MSPSRDAFFSAGDPSRLLTEATRCEDVEDAVAWVAEGRLLRPGVSPQRLIAALVALNENVPRRDEALQRLVRSVASSELDTAAVLFKLDRVTRPSAFRGAIDELARQSPTGKLVGMTPYSVLHAQQVNHHVMETLCALAGMTYGDAQERLSESLPGSPEGEWTLDAVRAVLALADAIIEGDAEVDVDLPGVAPMQPVEHLFRAEDGPSGWALVDDFRTGGVPLEVLVAQREVGGPWVRHRSATSSEPSSALAERLCEELDARGLDYVRASAVGGEAGKDEIETLVGSRSVGVIVLGQDRSPLAAIAFSIARDGGTARKNAGRLTDLASVRVPVALVLAGPGWKNRNETAELARAFGGGLYTDRDLGALAADLTNLKAPPPNLTEG